MTIEQPKNYIDEYDNTVWYLPSKGKGHWHRLDGPAIEFANGSKHWWINDKLLITKEVDIWLKENKIDLSEEVDQMAFKLRWL